MGGWGNILPISRLFTDSKDNKPTSKLICRVDLRSVTSLIFCQVGTFAPVLQPQIATGIVCSTSTNMLSIKLHQEEMFSCHLLAPPVYPNSPAIKCKLLLSIYRQLCVIQYGEIGRWWVKDCQANNSHNILHTFCLKQVGRIKVGIFSFLGA